MIRMRSGWNILLTFAAAATTTTSSFRLAAVPRGKFPRVYRSDSYDIRRRSKGTLTSLQLEEKASSQTTSTTAFMSSSLASPSASQSESPPPPVVRFVDIGANLLDEKYTAGTYFGKKRHEPDFEEVLERSVKQGVTHIILTAGTLAESRRAVAVVEEYRTRWETENPGGLPPPLVLACTVGVHPTRCQQEFIDNATAAEKEEGKTADAVLCELRELLSDAFDKGVVAAIGEIGLDYDRLEFTPKDVQKEFFRRQLDCFLYEGRPEPANLPLFLHNRSVGSDLLEILRENRDRVNARSGATIPIRGVVHSFDDSLELAEAFIDLGLYIGLNGCSLKTEENLAVVRELPLDRIVLETDCPYCEIKATHAGHKHISTTFPKKPDKKFVMGTMVKGRNEPNQIVQVAEVIAGVKGITVKEVADTCYKNSMDLYAAAFDGTEE